MKKKNFENFNWTLWWVVLSLATVGLVNLYSALSLWGEGHRLDLYWQQVVWFVIGFFLLFLMMTMDYHLWEKLAAYFYGFTIFLLVLVLVMGKTISGHKSWLYLGPIHFQPSELTKLSLIIMLAKYFSDNPSPWGYGFRHLLKPLSLALIPFVLVLLEKDLGSSLFFPLLFATIALVARIQTKTIALFLCLVSLGGMLGYRYVLKPYQKERIQIFLNPESDPKRSGYHLMQSKIAVGSGQFFGKGYLKGKINKLRYLPDKHTDFIFPVLAEEWGFLGSATVLVLFGFLLWQGMRIAQRAREPFGAYIACGVTGIFFCHFAINLGGVLGMIPLTGVPLPFFSYGGTATMSFLMGIGLLMNIHMRRFMF